VHNFGLLIINNGHWCYGVHTHYTIVVSIETTKINVIVVAAAWLCYHRTLLSLARLWPHLHSPCIH